MSVILFSTSLKTQGDVDSLSCERKILLVVELLAHDNIWLDRLYSYMMYLEGMAIIFSTRSFLPKTVEVI